MELDRSPTFELTIITSCKGASGEFDATRDSLKALDATSYNINIQWIIWDCTGTVESPQLENTGIEVVYLHGPDRGFYDGINKSLPAASGEFLLILNAGDRVKKELVESLTSILAKICHEKMPDIFAFPVLTWTGKIFKPKEDLSQFVHQGIIYRKALHLHYGQYLSVPNFTSADFLFFYGQVDHEEIRIQRMLQPITIYAKPGLSDNSLHFLQRDIVLSSFRWEFTITCFTRMLSTVTLRLLSRIKHALKNPQCKF